MIFLVLKIIKLDARGIFINKSKDLNRYVPENPNSRSHPSSASPFNTNRKNGDSTGDDAETLIFKKKKTRYSVREHQAFFIFKKKRKGISFYVLHISVFFIVCFAISSNGKKS